MANVAQKVGFKVRQIRKKKGIKQEQLAAMANIDYTYLNSIEAGKRNPTIKKLAKIARALEIPLKDLIP